MIATQDGRSYKYQQQNKGVNTMIATQDGQSYKYQQQNKGVNTMIATQDERSYKYQQNKDVNTMIVSQDGRRCKYQQQNNNNKITTTTKRSETGGFRFKECFFFISSPFVYPRESIPDSGDVIIVMEELQTQNHAQCSGPLGCKGTLSCRLLL